MDSFSSAIAALQLLAQRQELKEIHTKTQVVFCTQASKDNPHEAFATVSVQILSPPAAAGQPYTFAREYKEVGATYEEAAKKLALQLLKPLQDRHKDDDTVLALAQTIQKDWGVVTGESGDNGSFPNGALAGHTRRFQFGKVSDLPTIR